MTKTVEDTEPLMGEEKDGAERIIPKRKIVVEPMLILYAVAGFPIMTIKSQFMYQRVGQSMGIDVHNLTSINQSCHDAINVSDPNYIAREQVQAATAQWNIYLHLASFLPGFLVPLIFGTYSDVIGRRFLFILPCIGSMFGALLLMAIIYWNLPMYFFYLEVVEGLFGSMFLVFMGCFSYLADTLPASKRGFHMTIVDVVMLVNGSIAELFVGYWIRAQGFFYPCIFTLVGKFLALLYAIFFIPETVPKQKYTKESGAIKENGLRVAFRQVIKGLKLFASDDGSDRRWKLCLLLSTYLVADLISSRSVMTLFEMNTPLCWDSVWIGYFGSISMMAKCLATLLASGVFSGRISYEWQAVVSKISYIAEYTFLAFATTSAMMFISVGLGCLNFLSIPMTRAIMSSLVGLNEQGSLFAIMSCMSSLIRLFSDTMSNKIYSWTLLFWEGFIFLLQAITGVISLGLLLVYIFKNRKYKASQLQTFVNIQEDPKDGKFDHNVIA